MRYRNHESMLPSGAFQRRAGGGMRLHGGSDSGNYDPYEGQAGSWQGGGDSGGYWVPAPEAAPAPAQIAPTPENVAQVYEQIVGAPPPAGYAESVSNLYQGSSLAAVIRDTTTVAQQQGTYNPPAAPPTQEYFNPTPAPAPSSGGGYTVSDLGYAPATPAVNQTIWQQANDIYVQELGRNADPSGQQNVYNALVNGSMSINDVRNAIRQSAEYLQSHPVSDANTINSIYQQLLGRPADPTGLAANAGATPEQIRQSILNSAEYRTLNPQAAPAPVSERFRVEEYYDEGGGTRARLIDTTTGRAIQDMTVVTDDGGNKSYRTIVAGIGESGSDTYTDIDVNVLNQKAAEVTSKPYGAGEGAPLGYAYALTREKDGLAYKEFDAQGNLIRWRDPDWNWHNAKDVKSTGEVEVDAYGNVRPLYNFEAAGIPNYSGINAPRVMAAREQEGGGFFQGMNWKMLGMMAATALLTIYGPAALAALSGAGEISTGGFIAADMAATAAGESAFSLASALGMPLDEAVSAGLISGSGTLTDIGAAVLMEGAGIPAEVLQGVSSGIIAPESVQTVINTATSGGTTDANAVFNALVDNFSNQVAIAPIPGSETAAAGAGAGTATDVGYGGILAQPTPSITGPAAIIPQGTPTFLVQASKAAALNAAVTAVKGGSITDILKAAAAGVVGAGLGVTLQGVMEPGLLNTMISRAAASAGAAVVAGADPVQSALSGAIFGGLTDPNSGLLKGLENIDAYKGLSQNTKDYIINGIASGVSSAATGRAGLTTAMLEGAVATAAGKALDSVYESSIKGSGIDPAKILNDVTESAKRFFTTETMQDAINNPAKYLNMTTTAIDPQGFVYNWETGESYGRAGNLGLDQVADASGTPQWRNTATGEVLGAATGLLEPATGQQAGYRPADSTSDTDIFNRLLAGYEAAEANPVRPIEGSETAQAGGGTMTDAGPQTGGDGTLSPKENALRIWNELRAEAGMDPVNIDDASFNASFTRISAENPELVNPGGTYTEADFVIPEGFRRATQAEINAGLAQPKFIYSAGGTAQQETYLVPTTTPTVVPEAPAGPTTTPETTPTEEVAPAQPGPPATATTTYTTNGETFVKVDNNTGLAYNDDGSVNVEASEIYQSSNPVPNPVDPSPEAPTTGAVSPTTPTVTPEEPATPTPGPAAPGPVLPGTPGLVEGGGALGGEPGGVTGGEPGGTVGGDVGGTGTEIGGSGTGVGGTGTGSGSGGGTVSGPGTAPVAPVEPTEPLPPAEEVLPEVPVTPEVPVVEPEVPTTPVVTPPYILPPIVTPPPPTTTKTPTSGSYKLNWGQGTALGQGGMNPGWLMGGAVQPYYQTTDPTQAQYYWGQHPYIPTKEQIGLWNQPQGAPAIPFGSGTSPQTAFNTPINTLLPVRPY